MALDINKVIGPAISAVADLGGGLISREESRSSTNRNIDLQKEFAQHGIKWKVQDAIDAGVHPLAALGAQTTSFSPISMGSDAGGYLSRMGQNLSRAFDATASPEERSLRSVQLAIEEEKLKNMKLQNEGLRYEVDRLTMPAISTAPDGPPTRDEMFRGITQGVEPEVKVKIKSPEVTAHSETIGRTGGIHAQDDLYIDDRGRSLRALNQRASDVMESDTLPRWKLFARRAWDYLRGLTSDRQGPAAAAERQYLYDSRPAAPKDEIFLFNKWTGEWELHKSYPGDSRLFVPSARYQFYSID